ncbi:MAG: site-specific DNA-methyltransferase [Ignavibacteria bacterium]|nr:site-specific DNA-methyltransferase [Ignavibacteria bacterium]
MINLFFKSNDKAFSLLLGDCIELLNQFDFKFDMIFADPPYFLSNDGISVKSGKMVSVNKGEWDRSNGFEKDNEFNLNWLKACKEHLTENGTIWVSGTFHNIFSVAQMLTELEFKILNCITWAKTNPPPNLSCRYFTHSTEFIIWARKSKKSSHYYNYELMKTINGGTQMKDVWNLPAIAPWEKSCGKHPTQKPLALLTRIILASTKNNEWILDPFTGSSTTGIAANLANRKFLGIDKEEEFLKISKERKIEIENAQIFSNYRKKLNGFENKNQLELFLANEPKIGYGRSLDFEKITACP